MKTVFTVGVFFFFFFFFFYLFCKSSSLFVCLFFAFHDSATVAKYKPESPAVNSTEMRMYMVKAIRYVDDVVVYEDVDRIVEEVPFDIFVAGGDQSHEGFRRAVAWCEAHGKQVVRLPRTEGVSSTHLKDLIRSL